jgi:hypothetical protein
MEVAKEKNTTTLISYHGPFCIDILSNFGNIIKQFLLDYPTTANRIYKLFFELTQNVAKYSIEKSSITSCRFTGVGKLSLEQENDKFILRTSNLINKKDGAVLEEYCSEINTMGKEDLLKYRSEKRKLTPTSIDIGAHIGIIQVGLLTKNKVQFEILPLNDEHSVFTIWVVLSKE